jgi:hypothetical protein
MQFSPSYGQTNLEVRFSQGFTSALEVQDESKYYVHQAKDSLDPGSKTRIDRAKNGRPWR